jgi:hypothetical protein
MLDEEVFAIFKDLHTTLQPFIDIFHCGIVSQFEDVLPAGDCVLVKEETHCGFDASLHGQQFHERRSAFEQRAKSALADVATVSREDISSALGLVENLQKAHSVFQDLLAMIAVDDNHTKGAEWKAWKINDSPWRPPRPQIFLASASNDKDVVNAVHLNDSSFDTETRVAKRSRV